MSTATKKFWFSNQLERPT